MADRITRKDLQTAFENLVNSARAAGIDPAGWELEHRSSVYGQYAWTISTDNGSRYPFGGCYYRTAYGMLEAMRLAMHMLDLVAYNNHTNATK